MICSQSGDSVEIALDRVGVPVIPAEPPIVRRGVVHAEAVAREIKTLPGRQCLPMKLFGNSNAALAAELAERNVRRFMSVQAYSPALPRVHQGSQLSAAKLAR